MAAWLISLLLIVASATGAERKETEVTVYNLDLALIKEVYEAELSGGRVEFRLPEVSEQVEPSSVRLRSVEGPGKVSIREQRFEYGSAEPDRVLRRQLGRPVRVVTTTGGAVFRGELLSFDPEQIVLKTGDGSGSIVIVNRDVVADLELQSIPESLAVRPALAWELTVERAGRYRLEVSYLTRGLSWRADYSAAVAEDESQVDFSGYAALENNSGLAIPEAGLRLVAGDIHRASEGRGPRMMAARVQVAEAAEMLEESRLAEYHVYDLPWKTSIPDRQAKQVRLVPEIRFKSQKLYSYDGARDRDRVRAQLAFKNSGDGGPGVSLPAGTVRIYRSDRGGRLEFLGEDRLGHTPVDEEVRLTTGFAFDLVGERVQTASERLSDRRRRESYRIILRNHTAGDVTIGVVEHLRGDWEIIRADREYVRIDAGKVEFHVKVPAAGEIGLNYTVELRF